MQFSLSIRIFSVLNDHTRGTTTWFNIQKKDHHVRMKSALEKRGYGQRMGDQRKNRRHIVTTRVLRQFYNVSVFRVGDHVDNWKVERGVLSRFVPSIQGI